MMILALILISVTFAAEWTDTTWQTNPFMARLLISKGGGTSICGGSIISTNEWNGKGVILTAAHCVSGATNVNVGIGCTNSIQCNNEGASSYDDDHFVIHPLYDPDLSTSNTGWTDNDIALIYLSKAINNPGARKIGLHSDISIVSNNAAIRIFGYWGSCADRENCVGGSDTDTLEYADVNFMISNECDDSWGQKVTGPHDFCVKDKNPENGLQSVCMGDSGSPGFYQSRQIGLNSWGPVDCNPNLPTVLTSVPYYYEWICNQCPQCCVFDYPSCKPDCLENYGGCPNNIPCHQEKGLLYEVNGKCYTALTGCWGCLDNPEAHPTALKPTECAAHYNYPECKPMCLTNNGGCPNGVSCHQVKDRIYEVNGQCYTALTGCWGCLDNPEAHPTALAPTKCRAFEYPNCAPNCLINNGGCPNGVACHQVKDRIYKVNGQCYKALTGCWGCLNNPSSYASQLQQVSCGDYLSANSVFANLIGQVVGEDTQSDNNNIFRLDLIIVLLIINMCCMAMCYCKNYKKNQYKVVSVQMEDDEI